MVQVHTLVCLLAEAVAAVRGTVTQLRTPPPPPEGGRSLWSGLVSALSGRSAEVACGQYSADEMSRGVSHLDNALHLLAELYEVGAGSGRTGLMVWLCFRTVDSSAGYHTQHQHSTSNYSLFGFI